MSIPKSVKGERRAMRKRMVKLYGHKLDMVMSHNQWRAWHETREPVAAVGSRRTRKRSAERKRAAARSAAQSWLSEQLRKNGYA